jgi:outer membrane receptor protein involved in Fe transport
VTHKPNDALTVFGNLSQSNRVPTPIELGCADSAYPCRLPTGLQADPYLKQVISRTFEGGFRLKVSEQSGVSVALYRSDNSDDILFRAISRNGLGYFENFDRTRRQGVDIGTVTSIGSVDFRVAYSYLDATYQSTQILFAGERSVQVRPGTKIAGLPEHTLRLNLDWRAAPKVLVGGSVITTSSITTQGNEDGIIWQESAAGTEVYGNAKVKGYMLLNLHANYEAEKGLDYFARINNVFDTRFESYGMMALSMFNAGGIPITDAATGPNVSRFVAPGAPRNFMVGLRYRF